MSLVDIFSFETYFFGLANTFVFSLEVFNWNINISRRTAPKIILISDLGRLSDRMKSSFLLRILQWLPSVCDSVWTIQAGTETAPRLVLWSGLFLTSPILPHVDVTVPDSTHPLEQAAHFSYLFPSCLSPYTTLKIYLLGWAQMPPPIYSLPWAS